jgi:hypothetical protein
MARPCLSFNAGAEGVIAEIYAESMVHGGIVNCRVKFDRPVIGNCCHTNQLEPIIPPGMESLSETLALWLPEGETA